MRASRHRTPRCCRTRCATSCCRSAGSEALERGEHALGRELAHTRAQTAHLFLYGTSGGASIPFQGGTLCVQAPIRRTPVVGSGGTTLCSGVAALDMNAFARGLLGGTPSPALATPGTAVSCQAWGRDTGFPPPNDTSLSNALRYVVLP